MRTLALGGTVLALSLAVPTTLLAASPEDQPASAGPPATPAPVTAEQPSPAPTPTEPPPPPGDQAGDAPQPQPATVPAGRRARGRSAADRTARPTLASAAAAAKSSSVSIVGDTFSAFAFSPKSITVHVGDKVRWDNQSAAPEGHTVTGDGLDSGTFHDGQDYAFTFSRAGTFNYICALHPSMKGKVKVVGSSGGGGGSSSGGGGGGSSGSGSGASTSSGTSAGISAGDPGSSGQLPVTGLPLGGLGVAGLGLVALGFVLRRWAEYV